MPYAAKAIVQHDFDTDHLDIFLTFRLPMNQTVKPAITKWILKCDDVETDIVSSAWLDEHTLQLVSDALVSEPDLTTLEYTGPGPITYERDDPNRLCLETTWGKQWKAWGAIISLTGWPTTFKAGMIILWYGSITSIPAGWHLCDGLAGTPNLNNKFVRGAGSETAPGETGGQIDHGHSVAHLTPGPNITTIVQSGTGATVAASNHGHELDFNTEVSDGRPPYHTLCYIMKL